MPLYEYQCEGCGEVFELIQKFSDPPLTVHEKCGGPVRRLLSAPALQFKGSGWYVTDYAKGGNGGSHQPEKKSAGENKGSSDAAAGKESKPSPSSEPKSDSGTKPKSD